jgi:hypothetical protein
MNAIKQRIKKSSKIMVIITLVLCISLIVGLCVPVTFLIWHAIAPNADLSSLNGISFYSSAGQLMTTTNELVAEMYTILVSGVLILFVLFLALRIFQSISKDVIPFSQDNAKRLKEIAIVLVVYAIVQPIARACFYSIFNPEMVIRSSFNVVSIILAFIFFFISVLFAYGAELQRLSDETL